MPQGQPLDRPRRRPDHPGAPQRAAAGRAHRAGQGEVDRRVRDGVAGLEPGLRHRGVPVRQEREVEGRRGGGVSRARPAARRARRRRTGAVAQDGRGLVVDAQEAARTEVDHAARALPTAGPRSPAGSPTQRHDFYVLDEFTYPLKWGWVDVDEVVEMLAARPGNQHVVITGRDAPQAAARRRRPGHRDDQGQAPDGRRPQGPAGHRVVTMRASTREHAQKCRDSRRVGAQTRTLAGNEVSVPGRGDRRTRVRQRKDHRRNGSDGRAARGRAPGGAVQGRARLHRPGLSRARRGPRRPQPGPGAGRRAPDRPAVPARQRGRRHRRRRGRDGPVRRPDRRGSRRPGRRVHRTCRRRCSARRWCSSSTPAGRATASPRCCTASRRSISRCPDRRGDPQPGRFAAARAGAAPGVRAGRRAGARGDSARRRTGGAVTASRPGHRGRARQAAHATRSRR